MAMVCRNEESPKTRVSLDDVIDLFRPLTKKWIRLGIFWKLSKTNC